MSQTSSLRRNLRRIGAIFAGLILVVVLSIATDLALHAVGVFPPWGQPPGDLPLLLATVYRTVFAIAGSYVAARLAPDRPMMHALVLGGIGTLLAIAGAATTWNGGPQYGAKWYPIALILVSMPAAWMGGRICLGKKST